VLEAWHGRDENLTAGQQAFFCRARAKGAASGGADDSLHRRDWRDD